MAEKFQTDENYKPKVARNKNSKHLKHKDDYRTSRSNYKKQNS